MAFLSGLQGIWPGTPLAYVAVLGLAIVGLLAYRLTLHPLARFPGSFLARLTEWIETYRTTTGDRHLDQLKDHNKYGSVVRIGPNTLSFNTIGAVREIYGSRTGNVRKAPWYTVIEASAGGPSSLHAEIDRNIHASRRKVMEPAFTDKSLRAYEDLIVKNVQTFADIVAESGTCDWSEAFNLSQWATYLNYDIVGDLVFGKRFNAMTSDENRFMPKLIMNSTAFIYTVASLPLKALSRRILASGVLTLPIVGGDMARDDRKYFHYAKTVLQERIAVEGKGAEAQQDMMHYLLNAKDPMTGKAFSHEQLGIESSLLIAAGADTTSLTLAAAFFYLLRNPRVKHTLVEEIRSAFSESPYLMPSKLIGLPYLRAVVDETLRLSPPVPSLLPREVLKGGTVIDGNYIPEGTIVGVPAYAIHRNPEYFPEPGRFCPERWLAIDSDSGDSNDTPPSSTFSSIPRTSQSVSLARQAFVPFSQGSRGCIGRQLAYYELHTALAKLLHRFDIRQPQDPLTQAPMKDSTDWREGLADIVDAKDSAERKKLWRDERQREDEFQLFDQFLGDRNGPMVEFRERIW